MTYSHEVEHMCVVKKGPNHGPAPIPEEGKWVKSKEIKDISGLTHGIGWCAPHDDAGQQKWAVDSIADCARRFMAHPQVKGYKQAVPIPRKCRTE